MKVATSGEEMVVEDKTVIASYDYELKRAKEIPDKKTRMIEVFEGIQTLAKQLIFNG